MATGPVSGRRLTSVTVGLIVFGWALVTAADARHDAVEPLLITDVIVRTVTIEAEVEDVPTPIADALVDWPELERQTECLWTLLQESEVDLTFEIVTAAAVWTDALGGACLVIGEDD